MEASPRWVSPVATPVRRRLFRAGRKPGGDVAWQLAAWERFAQRLAEQPLVHATALRVGSEERHERRDCT
jgi:hypothetical protein